MSTYLKLVLAVCFGFVFVLHSYGMAGDLTKPSIAMPADAPVALRTNLLNVLSDPECKFLDGHIVNANTTLNYGGAAPALNRLINRLSEFEGVVVQVTFIKGDAAGPSWTVNHNGWGGASTFGIQLNVAASALDLDQLALTVTAAPKKSPPENQTK